MTISIDIDGPVIPADADNQVLRDAFFHSPIQRLVNVNAYHTIDVGVREGQYTDWIGTWDQSKQRVDGGAPTSILDVDRKGMRMVAGRALVVRVTITGSPTSLRGAAVTLRMALVGGRDGPAKALVAAGAKINDPTTRTAISALERQINTGGLAQWDETVPLMDPSTLGGPVSRLPAVSPAQITANQNNYNPDYLGYAAVLRLSSDASRDITGILNGTDGREIVVLNVGSQNVVLKNASASSAAINRFSLGADITLSGGGQGKTLWYDAVTSTWRAR